jgi:EAL domain-containing protein (putative c-di-GMP-specific phosphodiesterase class I)/FixJ family two-component response regulator
MARLRRYMACPAPLPSPSGSVPLERLFALSNAWPVSRMNILVVDDDAFALKLLSRQLQRLGCSGLLTCGSSTEALALMEACAADISLVFCDLQMPDVDGVEFIRHLGRLGYRGGLVLVSGEDHRILQAARRLAQAHSMQVLAALPKPVDLEMLRRVLEANAKRNARDPAADGLKIGADDIARAIEEHQFVNHYQPKVDLASGALVGVESLVRWRHPEAGLIYPDRFIGLAEEHRLINELTCEVFAMSMLQAQRWRAAGLHLHMAVNVSMDNLAELDFPDRIEQLALASGIPLTEVVLEVTESRLMKDQRASLDILARLRLKRIGVAIDDFGTGHSSLAQLRDVPFTELKLDRGFVSHVSRDPARSAIVEATLSMARLLGITSVGEGVETQADWDFLKAHGCDIAQGFLISAPLPGDAIPAWSAARAARIAIEPAP